MRQSRRFCLLQPGGVRWKKYNCTVKTEYYSEYVEGAMTFVKNYARDSVMSGAADYVLNSATGQYTTVGSASIAVGDGGTLYSGGGASITVYLVAGWDYDEYSMGTVRRYGSYETYSKGDYIGDVRAPEGEYPDAKNGYSLYGTHTFDGQAYTIMSYGGRYYAYIQA